MCLLHDDLYIVSRYITQTSLLIDVIFARGTAQRCTLTRSCLVIIQFLGLGTYSKVPIIRAGTYTSSAVHTMYCQNCPMFGTYNRSFRVNLKKADELCRKAMICVNFNLPTVFISLFLVTKGDFKKLMNTVGKLIIIKY